MSLGKNQHLLQSLQIWGMRISWSINFCVQDKGWLLLSFASKLKNTCSWFSETNVNLEKRVYVMVEKWYMVSGDPTFINGYTAIHIYINGWLQRFIGFYCIPSIMVYGYAIPVTMGILYHHRFKSIECSTAHKISRFSTLTGMAMKLHKLTSQTQICCFFDVIIDCNCTFVNM